MSLTYNGVTFDLDSSNGQVPYWTVEHRVARFPIPYANKEIVQSGGRGNPRMTIRAIVYSKAGVDTLLASQDANGRAWTDPHGTTWGDVLLVSAQVVARIGMSSYWLMELTFEREGS